MKTEPKPFAEFREKLAAAITAKIKDNARGGITAMGVDNLRMVVKVPPGAPVGANAALLLQAHLSRGRNGPAARRPQRHPVCRRRRCQVSARKSYVDYLEDSPPGVLVGGDGLVLVTIEHFSKGPRTGPADGFKRRKDAAGYVARTNATAGREYIAVTLAGGIAGPDVAAYADKAAVEFRSAEVAAKLRAELLPLLGDVTLTAAEATALNLLAPTLGASETLEKLTVL